MGTNEGLIAELVDRPSPRLTCDQGILEIVSLRPDQEAVSRTHKLLVYVIIAERGIRIRDVG